MYFKGDYEFGKYVSKRSVSQVPYMTYTWAIMFCFIHDGLDRKYPILGCQFFLKSSGCQQRL